ncbi:MAG TPA: OmpA family protein [Paludibacteraceae bacterium]|nr:OmpA family protein [Paludibacteraceae bacterium]
MKTILKFVFAFCIIFGSSANLFAQNSALQKANKLYELKAYAQAIPKYLQVLKKDSSIADAVFNLADCYRLVNDARNAETYYGKCLKKTNSKPIHKFYYAQALMENGKVDLAKKYMKEFNDDDRGKTFYKALVNLEKFYKNTGDYKINIARFNSPQNDFSPVIYKDKIVFVSARTRALVLNYKHSWTDLNYYFLYVTQKSGEDSYTKAKLFAKNIQTRYNDGPVCFDRDNKTIYFTRNNLQNNKVVRSSNGEVKLSLFTAQINEEKKNLTNIEGFNFNSKEYNTAHPAISADGKRLYFSSDMPGGQGGMDLWVVEKVNDAWGQVKNLGKKINTPGNEVFPCITENNNLYFSSNGLEGIGGLDIFCVALDEAGKLKDSVRNMGAHLNSTADDFGITFYPGEKKGFFSSNRNSYDLNDEIFEFTIVKPEKKPYTILVMDSITRKLLESGIVITDTETGEKTTMTEKDGEFIANLFPQRTHRIDAKSEGYIPRNNIEYVTPLDNTEPFEILLKQLPPKPKYFIAGTVYEILEDKSKIKVDSTLIQITDPGNNVVYSHITDTSGTYYAPDLKPRTTYVVTASPPGFFNKSEIVDSIPKGGAIRDFYVSRIVVGKAIKIENIYFDYDKSNIRPDAAIELNKIVKLLNENPAIIIELGSHTDCRGKKSYNEGLSDRRAKSSAAYIVSQGIDPSRISGKGYGENVMIMNCPCEGAQKSNCSEEDHQLNRRTEFKVTGFVKGVGNVNMKSDKPTNVITDPKPPEK